MVKKWWKCIFISLIMSKSLKMTEKNLSKYHSVLFKWLNEKSKSSSFFGEIHALISDYAKVSVQSSVTCCDFLFIPIVSVQWPMVGRQAWCHILSEKNVSTRSPNPGSTDYSVLSLIDPNRPEISKILLVGSSPRFSNCFKNSWIGPTSFDPWIPDLIILDVLIWTQSYFK